MFLDYFSYLLVLFLTGFSIYLVVTKKEFIKKHRNIIFYFFIGILVYSTYARYFSGFFTISQNYTIRDIPMGYCRWTAILIVVYAFTNKNKYLAQFIYFQAGLGFFSILLPGGDLFFLSQSHRTLGYLFDHYMIAMMTVFLVYIDDVKPSKKFMYIAMIYSFVVPFSLLPYALNTGHNVYYILDGVFIPYVFGNNQVVISIVYFIGMNLIYILAYLIGNKLSSHAENSDSKALFSPKYPWIILASFTFIGLFLSMFIIDYTPKEVRTLTDSYNSTPVKQLEDFGYIYEGEVDDESIYFIEIVKKYEEVEVITISGNNVTLQMENDIYYFNEEETNSETVIIILYKNKGEDNEKVKTYTFK